MELYKFIVWADSHWDKFGAKCVTLDDTDVVERAIFKRAKEGGFDFTLFAGDRYLKREPDDETKVRADRVIFDLVHPGNIPHYHLIGNHDWVNNTMRWHTAESMKLFNNVHVMDEAKTHLFKNVRIHALPADFEFDLNKFQTDPSCLNLFVFHDMLRGASFNEENTVLIETGIESAAIDLPQFDVVFAGDIHIRQQFNLTHTFGGYLGSVTQRNRGDSNIERGWTEVTATRNSPNTKWSFETRFVPTRNLFTRVAFNIQDDTLFESIQISEEDMLDQLVEVKLAGSKANVDRIADDPRWKKMEKQYKARLIDILRAYEVQQSDVVVDLTSSNSIYNDAELYLQSSFASLGRLKADQIMDALRKMREE